MKFIKFFNYFLAALAIMGGIFAMVNNWGGDLFSVSWEFSTVMWAANYLLVFNHYSKYDKK